MDSIKKIYYGGLIILFLALAALLALSLTETLFLKPYQRKYAPPGITDGQNVSPHTAT